ncbi:protein FAR1-RELATED SEQUENCE 5-like [Solanum tuberosum]|uniref:protein FAR1-RELATED SEQUENCE 5-like n=1 Tax=Solanum tuberosum TaxID=4113 RepID=UPI00073A4C58|nr:PREDICTED: protein FAR1-RELATED SEQUENCE 5-like [Solanum tuberosum]
MIDVGIRTKKAVRYLQNEAGGIENAGFIEQDAHNFVQAHKRNMISSGDAQTLINHFRHLHSEDSNFFYSFQVDEYGRLCNFFWRDSISRLHYECFGDVMIFDTTYRTNRYNMICAPFVVNNHWKNVFFGCAFLCNETTDSFVWLFQTFFKGMGGKAPKIIFTDQAHAMAPAIRQVFPNTCHRLCEWHIDRNAQKNIPQLYWKQGFRNYFDTLLWRCKSESEFEVIWQNMICDWNCADNSWLQKLYDLRKKWCPAFSRSIFSADIKSTQRSESTNRVFTEMTCKTMSITEFLKHYEQRTTEMHDTEATEDYKCQGKPKLFVEDCGILKHAGSVYSRRIFTRFQHEFLQGTTKKLIHVETIGTCTKYTILKGENNQTETVQFNSLDNSISCTYQMFETMGWLCCHALRVLFFDLNFSCISKKYILKRWTKNAKHECGFEEYTEKKKTLKSSKTIRLNGLMKESFTVMTLAANDVDSEEIAIKYLYLAKVEIIKHQSELYVQNHEKNRSKFNSFNDSVTWCKDQILDPIKKKDKGNGYGRMKSKNEQRKKKSIPENIEKRNRIST